MCVNRWKYDQLTWIVVYILGDMHIALLKIWHGNSRTCEDTSSPFDSRACARYSKHDYESHVK